MSKKDLDELLNSNYDGIQEYDNDLPRWWQALFFITIAFGVVYVLYYHVGGTLDSQVALDTDMKAIAAQSQKAPVAAISADTLLSFVKDSSHLAGGKAVFQAKCMPCHGPEGQGVVGPNLTDNYWIHGGAITDIHRTIEVGVPEKGMLAWKGLLTSEEINDVAAYVFSLKGTNPANPKAPQGDLVP